MTPIFATIALVKASLISGDKTPFTNFEVENISGKKTYALSELYDFSDFQKVYKKLGIKFNDLLLMIWSKTMKEHFDRTNWPKVNDMIVTFAVNLRPPILGELKLDNDVSFAHIKLPMIDKISQKGADLIKSRSVPAKDFI